MGNSRYRDEELKAIRDAHAARIAQFNKSEAAAKVRRAAATLSPANPEIPSNQEGGYQSATPEGDQLEEQ